MDKLVEVIKIYDKDGDGFLDQEELAEFQKDVDYAFSLTEIEMYNLGGEKVSMDSVVMAVEHQQDATEQGYLNAIAKHLDTNNDGKVFVPALINFLKNSGSLTQNEVVEIISNLPCDEDHYFTYKN